jgi:C4-dicarboxylate transporter DctM subunit
MLGHIMIIKLNSYPLLAVLFFILAGNVMVHGKIAEYLINFAGSMVGFFRGGLAISGVVASALFGGISGSALADYAAIGGIMVPALRKNGYGERFSVGIMAANSVLGIIIPPSIPMIIYCLIAEVSIGRLFLAGFLPGIFVVGGVSIWINFWARKNRIGKWSEKLQLKNVFFHFRKGIWALFLPGIIFAGIFLGVFTSTEAAVLASVYAIVVELFIYRFLKVSQLVKIFIDSCVTTGTLLILVAGASAFSEFMTLEQFPETIIRVCTSNISSPHLIILVIAGILLIVGCFIDIISALLIFTPIIVPLSTSYNIDLIHLGLVTVFVLGIGYVTPPFGGSLFIAVAMHNAKFMDVVVGSLPSMIIWIIVLIFLCLIPQISILLPSLFMGPSS